MTETNLQDVVEQYLAALAEQNVERCMAFYDDDASIGFQAGFQSGMFKGRADLEEWHKDRFAAGFRVVTIDGITVDGDTVTVDAVATSNRLKAWKIGTLSGTATLRFELGKVKEVQFGLRMYNPLEGW